MVKLPREHRRESIGSQWVGTVAWIAPRQSIGIQLQIGWESMANQLENTGQNLKFCDVAPVCTHYVIPVCT